MSILSTINNHSAAEGMRIVIAGNEKVGKTTLTADAPNALLVPLEVGYRGINIPRTKMIENYTEASQLLDEIIVTAKAGQFPYTSIIFDSCTALERLINDSIVQADPSYSQGNIKSVTIDSALGGYGKAHTFANELFSSFLHKCDQLAVYGGINIIMTCHVFAATLIDPINGQYESWDLLLHSPKNQKTYGKREILTQWADIIGFLYEPVLITQIGDVRTAVSQNKGRILGLARTPSYIAGNRFGIEGEIPIPKENGWNYLAQSIYQASGLDIYKR